MFCLLRGAPFVLPGTALVGFLLATGRWGSYLGVASESIFVTDVALAITATWLVTRHAGRLVPGRVRPLVPVLALASWSVVRFAVGGHFDLVAVRDLAPYVYVLVALAACFNAETYSRTLLVLEVALAVHLVWVHVSLQIPALAGELPLLGGQVHVLELRPDFDGAALAVLSCLAVIRAGRREQRTIVRVVSGAVAVASLYAILAMGSRAGLLALIVDLGLLAAMHLHLIRRIGRARALATAGLVVATVAIVFPHTYVYDRLTADPTKRSDAGSGTLDARRAAWGMVIEDAAENPARLVFGSGFGADFLDRSGAAVSFEGYVEKGVRAPHNFILNTLARTGLVGVALLGWVVVSLGRATIQVGARSDVPPDRRRVHIFAVLVLGALGVASLVGVILESPFGAVPFWWAAGILLVGSQSRETRQKAFWSTRSSVSASS